MTVRSDPRLRYLTAADVTAAPPPLGTGAASITGLAFAFRREGSGRVAAGRTLTTDQVAILELGQQLSLLDVIAAVHQEPPDRRAVFPARGQSMPAAASAVPRRTTPRSRLVITYAVSAIVRAISA